MPSVRSIAVAKCGYCGFEERFPESRAGSTVKCQQCGDKVPVKVLREGPRKRKRPGKVEIEKEAEEPIGSPTTAPVPVRDPRFNSSTELARVPETTDRPKPTEWWMLSDVVEILLLPSAAVRALMLSFSLVVVTDLGRFAYLLFEDADAIVGELGELARVCVMFVCGLPLAIVAFWTLAFGGTCYGAITEATAAGTSEVDWPEAEYGTWLSRSAGVIWVTFFSLILSAGVGMALEAAVGDRWVPTVFAFVLLQPIFLLGALELGQPWVPVSFPVLGTLVRAWRWWLTFYFLTALVATFWVSCCWIAYERYELRAALVISGPILAHATFVHGRLLGRLAWKIQESGVHLYGGDDD